MGDPPQKKTHPVLQKANFWKGSVLQPSGCLASRAPIELPPTSESENDMAEALAPRAAAEMCFLFCTSGKLAPSKAPNPTGVSFFVDLQLGSLSLLLFPLHVNPNPQNKRTKTTHAISGASTGQRARSRNKSLPLIAFQQATDYSLWGLLCLFVQRFDEVGIGGIA